MPINIGLYPLTHARPFKFGTWDIEAANWWDLQVIGCFDGNDYYQFRNVEDFLNHILRWEYRDYRWFAHFGGRYDLNFIFDWIRIFHADLKISFYCSGSMVMQMSIRKGDCHAKLCDSFRLLPASLRELGLAFNVKHKKTAFDFKEMEYGRELLEYNEQDCRCLYEVLLCFFEQTGVFSETFASHSLKVWRKDFLKEVIWKPNEKVLEFVRYAYHGGRVEVFKKQSAELNAYDVNSMYPYVMLSPIPVRFTGESRRLYEADNKFGFVYAEVDIPPEYVTLLPVRFEKLFFPCGKIKGIWTNEELIAAERYGVRINKIFKAYYFECSRIFQTFVEKLYHLKKTAEEPTRTIAKYLLNSLYGKFGQNPTKKVYITENDAPDRSTIIVDMEGKPTGFAYYERTSNAAYLLPHIAASITAKARLELTQKLNEKTYYCDTDSVFTTDRIETGKEIGQWSEVGQGEALFIQPKLYKFKGVWKAKGLNREQSIDDFVAGKPNLVIRRKSIKEALRDGKPACADVNIEKTLRLSRPKRAWISEQETRPWNITELKKK